MQLHAFSSWDTMKIPVRVLWEAKGDVHSLPFCTGLLLFCEISPKQPHLMHSSPYKLFFSPWEKRNFFLSIRISIHGLLIPCLHYGLCTELQKLYLLLLQKLGLSILLLTFPLLQGVQLSSCSISWITSGSTSAFLLSHIFPDLFALVCISFPL